jgi:membrane-bound serine protease (ClpP class)
LVRLVLLASSLTLLLVGGATAAESRPVVDVINVKGLIDPALFDYVRGAIASAERRGVAMIVLQIDSLGSYGDRGERLGEYIRGRPIPVVAWIAPGGARVQGGSRLVV